FDRVTFDLPATPSGRALSDAFSSIRITYKFAGIASEDLIAISRWDGTEWRFAPNELKAGATAVCTPDCAAPISFEFSTLAIEPDDLRADDAIRLRVYGSVPSSALVDTIVAVSIPVNGITFLTPALLPTGGTLDSTGPDNPYNAATLTVIQLLADFTIDGPDSVVAGTTVEYTLTGIDEFGDPYTFPGATGTESYTARTTPTGDETVSISRPGQGGTITRTMAITILPDVLDEIIINGPTTVVAGVEETYTHSGEDQYDNGVPLAVTSQTFLEIEARDDYQVTYSEAGKTGTLDVTVVAADLASILVDGPAELVVAETGTYTAAGFDEFDNDVVLGDLSFTVSRDCLAPPCVVTNEDGSFDVTAPTSVGALTVEITDADTGFVDSFEIPILAGPPSYLEIVADPDEITNDADDSTTITGWLRDEFGNDVDVADVAVTLDATSGSLDDTDLVTDDQGFFATTYRPDPADPTGYIATVSGTSDEVDVVSAEITVLDVRAPVLTTTTDGLDFFSPSLSPGVKDSVGGTLAVSEPSYLIVEVYDADDFFVATLIEVDLLSPGDVRDYSWDGLDDAGLPVPDGTYVLYLYAEDTGGLVDDEIRVVELDDTAPTFTGGPDRDTVGAGVVTLEFASTEVLDGLPTVLIARSDRADPETCDAGTLAVADDSGLVFTCDYTVVAGTADSMSIRVSGTDLAGNPGETEVGSFGLDFVAPGAISLDSILLANNAPPADDSVSGVAGSAEPGAEVCAVDAADEFDFACVTAGDDGSWGPIGIPDGTSRFGLVQTDAAGNRGSDATFVDIDTVGPEVLDIVVSNPFFSPTASVGVKDTSTLTFTAPGATGYFLVITDEDGADVLEYPESGLAAFPAEFEWDGADADGIVADGTYTVSIYAVDDGGNVGYGAAFFTVDDLAPEFSDVSVGPTPIDGVMYVDSAFFDVFAQIVDEHGLEAAYVDVGGALGSVTGFEPPAAVSFGVLAGDIVSEGPASVTIYALDLAGNAGSLTVDGLVVVDRTAPELVLATPSSRPAQLAAQELGVDASDTNLDTITLLATSDTLNILGLDKVAAGEFTVRFEAPTTTGLYAYKLQLADAAGNLAVPFDGTFEVTPADLASVELVGCSARVTETCALSARAFDAFGNEKASGVAFAFEITNADAGSVDADGLFTAGTLAGVFADALSVAGDDGSFIASAEGPATVLPGDLAEVVVSGDTTIVAGTTKAYSVSGRDAHGNDIALDPSSFEFIAPTAAGPASVRYPEPGSGLEGTLDVTVLADALASITVSGPASLEVGTTGTFALAGFDKYGNAVALAVPAKDFTAPETAGCGVLVTYTEAGITGSTSLCALAGPLASITIGGPASVVAGSTTDFPL
ncbi:MAG TPA: FlgD immunoglobulin-like domain containing protein, partial [Candidatus Thermoplasmatota archaeon]|nr:FlgD immunoglobulin-like domain containing protein [Candidatus Thermoplasmatota archaeon]